MMSFGFCQSDESSHLLLTVQGVQEEALFVCHPYCLTPPSHCNCALLCLEVKEFSVFPLRIIYKSLSQFSDQNYSRHSALKVLAHIHYSHLPLVSWGVYPAPHSPTSTHRTSRLSNVLWLVIILLIYSCSPVFLNLALCGINYANYFFFTTLVDPNLHCNHWYNRTCYTV